MTGNFFNPIFQFRFKQSLHLGNTDFTEQEVKAHDNHNEDQDEKEDQGDDETIPSVSLWADSTTQNTKI